MRFAAVAFALALGIATPAIGAPSITDWSEEQFLTTVNELMLTEKTCDRLKLRDIIKVINLLEVANEKFGPVFLEDSKAGRYKHVIDAVDEATSKPATFCWAIEEKYGPQGTVLPGMVRAR